jgi:hypothetical protein
MTTTSLMTLTGDRVQDADRVGTECNVARLVEEIETSLGAAELYIAQQIRDWDTTYSLWEGQTDDGRQWDDVRGADEAFPWDGASDARVFYADEIICEQVRIMRAACRRMRVQATPLRGASTEKAQNATILLTWLFNVHLKAHIDRQVGLLARWRQQFGYAVLGVWWRDDVRVKISTLKLGDLQKAAAIAAQNGQAQLQTLVSILADPAQDEQAIALLQVLSPLVTKRAARSMLQALRTKGECQLPKQEVVASLPRIKALRPFVDVFFPALADLQSDVPPRWIAYRQFLPEAEIRSLAAQHGWEEKWVETVLERGRGKTFDNQARRAALRHLGETVARPWWQDSAELEHLVEIVWHYRRGVHELYDLPCHWLSVYCPAVKEYPNEAGTPAYAFHGMLEDDQYPFFGFTREDIDDATAESRGVAQIAKGWQADIKTERDQFRNRASINSLPPLLITASAMMGRTRLPMGPGVQHPLAGKAEMKWLTLPQTGSDSAVALKQAEREGDRYFARAGEHTADTSVQLANEEIASGFLIQLTPPVSYILKLAQKHLAPVTIAQVTGDTQLVELSHRDIDGMFDLQIQFNADDLNFELVLKKLEAWNQFLLAADTLGVIDRAEFLKAYARLLDKDLADRIVGSPQQATEKQVNAAKLAWTQIVSGVEPAMAPEGQNYNLQMQVIQQLLQNPVNQQRIQMLPDARVLLQRYLQHLQFGAAQQQNAQTGKVGVKPLDVREIQDEMERGPGGPSTSNVQRSTSNIQGLQ